MPALRNRVQNVWPRLVAAATLLFAAGLTTVTNVHATPYAIVDDRGIQITLHGAPQRIVSLLPSLTESVCTLGRCQQLVGVDRYSNWPTSIKRLPQLGGGLDPNIEAIVALKPDLVLVASSAKAAFRLESLGIPVAALEPKNLKEMKLAFSKVGTLLGVDQSAAIWQGLEQNVAKLIASAPRSPRPVKVYFEASAGPYGASESSFIGELIQRLGAHNILPGNLGPYPKINPEFVVRANPDIIMVGTSESGNLASRPGWANMNAVKNQRVCAFSPEQGDILVRAGPRMVQATELMVSCLSGKLNPASADNTGRTVP
jgi:iron complex transport system substrate-binding protein